MQTLLRTLITLALIASAVLLPAVWVSWLDHATEDTAARMMRTRGSDQVLRVATMRHLVTYYLDANNRGAGLEFDLVSSFADTQRARVEWRIAATPEEANRWLDEGEVDLAALGLPASSAPVGALATKSKFRESAWILLHTPQKFQPKSFGELLPKRVVVSARLFGLSELQALARKHPKIEFVADPNRDDEALMLAVGNDEVPYALVEEDTFNASRHFHYDTQRAFIAQPPLARVWVFRRDHEALRDEADRFLQRATREGSLARILDRYFGFPLARKQEEFEIFTERVTTVLPRYRKWFQEAQEKYGIEWRLLAAISYQESHWNADATSETGVRGIMQFTEDTAKRFGVDRLDPYSSILGGARYINELKSNVLAARIPEPDRTWLALAAYNIGYGHVENARILTERNRRNPDSWVDVRRHLPLLMKPEIAAQFKLGVCRCGMPVDFVDSVRAFHDLLLRLEPEHKPRS